MGEGTQYKEHEILNFLDLSTRGFPLTSWSTLWGTWLIQLVEHTVFDLRLMGSSPTLDVEII